MNRTVKRGDVGSPVRQLQLLLRRRVPPARLRADGRFGPATEAAVKAFQKSKGLAQDGVVGNATWVALGVQRPLRAPAARADVGNPRDWMAIAEAELGVQEIAGRQHHARILEYHGTTRTAPKRDETAWCSSFVNWVLREAGASGTNSAAARSWIDWGAELTTPRRGAVMVTKRDGADVQSGSTTGYHVAFYLRSNGDTFEILGGNQANSVSVGTRRYSTYEQWWYRWPG